MIKDIPCTLSIVTKTSQKTGNDYKQVVLKVKAERKHYEGIHC